MLRVESDAWIEFHGNTRLANVAVCRTNSIGMTVVSGTGDVSPAKGFPGRVPSLLEVVHGSCLIERCDLSNCEGSAIKVSGAHTSPSVLHNNIHGCGDTGVVFKEGADGTLASNKLFMNGSVAIEVHSLADPRIEDNDIFDGKQGGIFVYGGGKGHFRRNKIFRNALEGMEIKQGGRPLVEDNDIYDNLECGIFIHEAGEGRIIGNRIHSNYYAGIEIKDQSTSSPEVRNNDVYSGRTSGMYIHSGGRGIIEGNRIHQNWLHGVYVRNKGCPINSVVRLVYPPGQKPCFQGTSKGPPALEVGFSSSLCSCIWSVVDTTVLETARRYSTFFPLISRRVLKKTITKSLPSTKYLRKLLNGPKRICNASEHIKEPTYVSPKAVPPRPRPCPAGAEQTKMEPERAVLV